jgi:signal transduction histidine kinase
VWDIKYNFKKLNFVISNSIIIGTTILSTLIINYTIISNYSFSQESFVISTIILTITGIILYLYLAQPLFELLLKNDEDIKSILKETIHEINTPVSTIQINTQMIKKQESNIKNIARLDRIEKSCYNLLNLYEQIEYNLKKNTHTVELEKIDLKNTIDNCIDNFQDIKNNIIINNKLSKSIFIKLDINGFIKIINNLLSNGIKYNKNNGFINIDFKNNILSIENSGKGINTENIFKVFDKYYQEHITQEGIGLGLNIVKEYCDNYNIKINIKSDKNSTIFFLNLESIK